MPEDESLPEITLEELPEPLQQACARAGWTALMPVQAKAIPYLLAGRDLMIQSRTGSGKTGSFGLPILGRIKAERNECQALVLVPTRELAQQVAREIELISAGTGVRTVAVFGGTGYATQLEAFRQGAHVVVGTPGRVLDHLLRGSLNLGGLDTLVFDEADRMLSIGFYPDMKQVQRYLPRRRINMLMTSATYPHHVLRLAGEFMDRPRLLSLSGEQVHVADTPHVYYECPAMQKDRALVRIIELKNPATGFIFCNTKQHVHYLTTVLQRFGYDADELSGDLTQVKREQVLERLRTGNLRFLVATDVAARGIDVPDISHVFLYEPPDDHEVYIHRAGRTGRAGATGEVISLVDVMERLALERIAKTYKIKLEKRDLPSDDDLAAAVGIRVTALLEARIRELDNVTRERIQRFVPLVRSLSEHEDIVQLVAMLLDECYQKTLHSTPQPPAPKPPKPREERRERRERKPAPARNEEERIEDAQDESESPAPKKRKRRRRKPRTGEAAENGAPQTPSQAAAPRTPEASQNGDAPEGDAPAKRRRPRKRRRKPRTGEGSAPQETSGGSDDE
ncbi:DEAD/DEAH box helicase [Desulfobaculum xiamenense]|nr:DEAD/DEAH box helicase [Desulfobaculum xiamenense]